MVLSIFWLIENSAWINLSKFWWKFHEKSISGNTGLKFFLVISSAYVSVSSWNAKNGEIESSVTRNGFFMKFIQAEFSINQKMEKAIILYIENNTSYQIISHFDF